MKHNNLEVKSAYPAFVRSVKGVLFYTLRKLPATCLSMLPILPLFMILGLVNIYISHALLHERLLGISLQSLVVLCDVILWGAAVCYLHHRYIGHPMSWLHAFYQAMQSLGGLILVFLTYLAFLAVYYEVLLLMRRFFVGLHPNDFMKLLLLSVLFTWCFVYVLANVMLVMAFAVILIEKESFVLSLKRSNALVQSAWLKSLMIFVGLSALVLFVCMPDTFLFMSRLSFYRQLVWQCGFALILIPFVLSWYLISYNDTKLCLQAKKNSHD